MKKQFTILLLLGLIACKKHNDGTRKESEIWLHDRMIEPYETKITKGTTITFINKDQNTHTISETNNMFYSGKLKSGQSYAFTFSDTGRFAVFCNYHNSMLGEIKVE